VAGDSSGIVKSAGRVFDILELFEAERRALSAIAITRALKYPPSSTVGLLKSMVKRGYLFFDPASFTYFPTPRLMFLVQWISRSPQFEADLLQLLEDVVAVTNESSALICENDIYIQYMRIKSSTNPIAFNISEGQLVPIFASIAGLTALSAKTDAEIVRLAERVNRRVGREGARVDCYKHLPMIKRFRAQGYGVGYDVFATGVGLLAWPIRPQVGGHPMVLSVGGPTERIRAAEGSIIKSVTALLKKYKVQ
jgi:DNA-binding IclR family transcriptional regulator